MKARALEPQTDSNTTSVFRVHGLSEPQVWDIGHRWVSDPQAMPLHGRAEFTAEAVASVGLFVVESEPPPRHAEIDGWPPDKSAAISVAQQLAARALYRPHP